MPVRTELIWDGKYGADGKRVAPLRVALPFQTVETVNETAQERDRNLFQFAAQEQPWRNRLVWGDKKYVLPSLLSEFAGKINLIYIDPPFDTGADFSFTAAVPPSEEEDDDPIAFTKQPSLIEQKAYRDTWGRGIDSYLQWFYETVVLLHELLGQDGSAYIHLGPNMSHYAKAILDEVFGPENYLNEIIWKRQSAHSDTKQGSQHYGRLHDVIFFYKKGDYCTYNQQYQPYDQAYVATFFKNVDESGRRFQYGDLTGPGGPAKGNPVYEFLGVTRAWRYSKEKMQKLYEEGRIEFRPGGKVPRQKRYLDESPGVPAQDIWSDITYGSLINFGAENLGYPTQKPEAFLERVVKTSSNEGDLVLDCFCGSGTTAAVAEKLNRRWIGCDLGRFAIHTTRKRLLQIPDVRPFVVQNLGKYERQLWQAGEFAGNPSGNPSLALGAGNEMRENEVRRQRAYVEFILRLYNATPLNGYTWLHGTKGGRPVHVGSVEAPISVGDVKNIAAEFKKAVGTGAGAPTSNGVDLLGWDFAFEMNEVARQQAADANIRMNFKRIPRDVMDKRAVEQGDVKFFELAALGVSVKVKGGEATLTLADFVIPPDDVPEEVRQAVKHWSQWIDYWAVDWDNKGDTFHNQWQAFRTRKEPKLPLSAAHTYAEPGEYRVVVKVIDILGNDTTKTVKVKVK
jgi:DNA modification methylase